MRRLLRNQATILKTAIRAICVLTIVSVALSTATASWAAVGPHTPAEVNAAVAAGVAYIDAHQNANGSFGSSLPSAETAFAVIAYGVLDKGNISNLPPAMQTHLRNAVTYLLSLQNADGSFGASDRTYTTGLTLDALSASSGAGAGIPTAISNGRTYLIKTQNAPPAVTGNPSSPNCSTADRSGSDFYCGGWNYDAGFGRSDESNTGFAQTGLFLTGGLPAATAAVNVGWQRHIQELKATNYFATRNDGGGCYQPGSFCSGANDNGSLLFGLGYDGVAASDPMVQAALTIATDTLDEYELMKATVRTTVFHTGMNEDGTCVLGNAGCDWALQGDGGYHYSLWALTKGFGLYIPPDLSNLSNWYAKVADLLLTQQNTNGSWPVDGRDDFTSIVATSFAVDALGLVGVPTHTLTVATSGSGTVTSAPSGIDCGATCSASFSQGTIVSLTATPGVGATFTGWGGACSGTGACSVTMDQDRLVTATFTGTSDTTAPACNLTAVIAGPPKQLQITVQDSDGGLKSILITALTNATVSIPAFTVGTTSPVVVTATKIDQTVGASVTLQATDVAGNVITCDPAMVTVNGGPGKPASKVVTGVAQAESTVSIYNNAPGLKQIDIKVNGRLFKVTRLHDGEVRTINVASGLKAGTNNTIVLTPRGMTTGSAEVLISDMGKHTAAQHGTTHVVIERPKPQEDSTTLD